MSSCLHASTLSVFLVLPGGDCLVVSEPPFSIEAQDQGWLIRDSIRRRHVFPHESFFWGDSCYLISHNDSRPRAILARGWGFDFACSQPTALLVQFARVFFSRHSRMLAPTAFSGVLAIILAADLFPPRIASAPTVRVDASTLRTHHLLATLASLPRTEESSEEKSVEDFPEAGDREKFPNEITARRAKKRPKMHAPKKLFHTIDTLRTDESERSRSARFFLPPSTGHTP